MPVQFADQQQGNNAEAPPPWNKDHAPYNALAYLIDKEKVRKGMKPQKVHELLPLFTQYTLTRFRNNYNNMLKKYAAGTLTYNTRVIPENTLEMLRTGNGLGGARLAETSTNINESMEGKSIILSFVCPLLAFTGDN